MTDRMGNTLVFLAVIAASALILWGRVSVDDLKVVCGDACAPFAWSGWRNGETGCWCKTPDPTTLRLVHP